MRSISKRALVALVAVFALSAAAAVSASAALPEFSKTSDTYTAKTGGLRIYDKGTQTVTCNNGAGEGSVTGAKTFTSKFAFTGCHGPSDSVCTSEGAASGEVKTGELAGELVYISKAKKEAGLIFNQTEAHKLIPPTFASMSCGGEQQKFVIRRGAIAPVIKLNELREKYTFTLSAEEKGYQTPKAYENEKGESLNEAPEASLLGGPYFEGALATSIETTFAQELRINA